MKDSFGNITTDQEYDYIRKSHIISPPHEFLDMEEDDPRFIKALLDTQKLSKAKTIPQVPAGKFIRKNRGSVNVLLIIYVLDPKGFNGKLNYPAVGYALSFPEIKDDEKLPDKVNQQFIDELFAIPEDAEENPEVEDED